MLKENKFSRLLIIQVLIYLFVNSLFIIKYISRLQVQPLFPIITYLSVVAFSIYLINKIYCKKDSHHKVIFYLLVLLIGGCIIGLNLFIDPMKLKVDRWSAIHNFLNNLFSGVYPYAAKTHLGGYGSPFPIWQLFHVPFYIMGNVGWGMLFMFILLVLALRKFLGSLKLINIYLFLLLISPAFWYEVAVRSDLFYNFLLCFILVVYFHKKGYSIQKNMVFLVIACGLMLSTRLTIVIPFGILLGKEFFLLNLKKKFVFVSSIFAVFALTFLPLILWDFHDLFFFKYSPFNLQRGQGSMELVVLLVVMIVYCSFKWNGSFRLYSHLNSLTFFIFVFATFVHLFYFYHFKISLFDLDISYFNMGLPFTIFAMMDVIPENRCLS